MLISPECSRGPVASKTNRAEVLGFVTLTKTPLHIYRFYLSSFRASLYFQYSGYFSVVTIMVPRWESAMAIKEFLFHLENIINVT